MGRQGCDVHVVDDRLLRRQCCQLVEVSGEETKAADFGGDVFADGPSQPEAIVGGRSSAELIDDDERVLRGRAAGATWRMRGGKKAQGHICAPSRCVCAHRRMAAVSSISDINVDTPFTWLSPAPTLARTLSITLSSALSHGTKQPICAIRAITPTCRINVDFPPIFGPVDKRKGYPQKSHLSQIQPPTTSFTCYDIKALLALDEGDVVGYEGGVCVRLHAGVSGLQQLHTPAAFV